MLTIVRELKERSADKHILVLCKCSCGRETVTKKTLVLHGKTRSCGCLKARNGVKHGMRKTPTYAIWQSAKQRSLCPTNKNYDRYGAVGISMCDRWANSFEAFLEDMGPRPDGMSLDRIDNNKGYELGNCRWATDSEQQRNRPKTYVWHIKGNEFQSAQEAADHFGVTIQTICKWTLGYLDARRSHQQHPKREPRHDCWRTERYLSKDA
jgi:hypothetical protein